MSCENIEHGMDMKTPYNVQLTAFYKRSFAFYTVKERMPVIITNIIDHLVRYKDNICRLNGEECRESIKTIIGEISKLKYEIQTNKPITQLFSNGIDIPIWNDYLLEQNAHGTPTFFNTVWLYSECYMYRRIRAIFEASELLMDFDPFRHQKEDAYTTSNKAMTELGKFVLEQVGRECTDDDVKQNILTLIKVNLWGNKCDLSLSLGANVSGDINVMDSFEQLDKFILVDQSESIWETLSKNSSSDVVRFVLDNAGYELFTDLCLADYILTNKLAKTIYFHAKCLPWFISDVMVHDFHWLIDSLSSSEDKILSTLGKRWKQYKETSQLIIEDNIFWTLPYDYSRMKSKDPSLYSILSESKLIIFKGDLNYRKLLGEVNWDPTISFEKALQGFHPSNLCTLRTLKADIICGLDKGIAERLNEEVPNWLISGDFGVIQYCAS